MIAYLLAHLVSSAAIAHPQDMGALRIVTETNHLSLNLELKDEVFARISGSDLSSVQNLTSAKAGELLGKTLAREAVQTPSGECHWEAPTALRNADKISLAARSICPAALTTWKLKLGFLAAAPAGFELLVKIDGKAGASTQEFVATAFRDQIDIAPEVHHSLWEFVQMGVDHIGATPSQWNDQRGFHLPDGIDHILFVIAILIGGGSLLNILKTVTGFTIGHSVTLALATLGIVHVPSRWVECAIALSICFVAAESLLRRNRKSTWRITLAFGLIHGLGFASALAELHLDRSNLLKALLGFNLGVELGQAIIVALILPIIILLYKDRASRRYAIPLIGVSVFVAGAYWFIQRAFVS